MGCSKQVPEPDLEQQKVYNIEDLPLSDNLVKHINSGKKEKYTIYTFYTPLDKEKIHNQYWEGIIVFDELQESEHASSSTDKYGNKTVNWRQDQLRGSYSRDVYNVQGLMYKRTTINPDGSSIDSVDLNGDGVVDYMEVLLPNGDVSIVANERLGKGFLDESLKGNNPYCNHSDMLGVQREELPGCGNSAESDGSSGAGLGSTDAGNPYHDYMEGLCAGHESNPADNLSGGTRASTLVKSRHRMNVTHRPNEIHFAETIEEFYNDGSVIHYETHTIFDESTGRVTTRYTKTHINPDGSTVIDYSEVSDDGATQTASPPVHMECSSDGECTSDDDVPISEDTEHPGFEADHEAAMAEFCAIWSQSQEDRPNDVSELNERANEERCSIAPDESNATEGSSLAETCYFDIVGRDEIAEMVAGGVCVSATGGTHFDYDSESPQICTQNRFYILENWLIMNGPAGIVGIEDECRDNPACDPANLLRPETP